MYICVDFDGTIVDYRFPAIGAPVPGAMEWLKRWTELGGRIILFTMRSDGPDGRMLLSAAVGFLEERGVKLYGANVNPDQAAWSSSPKAYGHCYVDDAGFGCPLVRPPGFARPCVDWSVVGPAIEARLLARRRHEPPEIPPDAGQRP
ncbi:MAG TPA: hypothetical protein PK636_03270 [bacterium]|nr:hypothetical protein [bacterium]HPJ71685.1 hypothetical protein [bacterium]HPQ65601.1 hypothetical protein [bacterium]